VSHDMSNEDIIKAHQRYKSHSASLEVRLDELAFIKQEIEELSRKVRAAEEVSYIHKGVPMSETSSGGGRYNVDAVSRGISRFAHIYKNTHNNRTWGLDCRKVIHNRGEWMGAKWKTKNACVEAAKEWVATGVKPEFNGGA